MGRIGSRRQPPEGFATLQPFLASIDAQLKAVHAAPHDTLRRNEPTWAIMRLHHQRTRHIYEEWRAGRISAALLDYLKAEGYADGALMALWKKPGYENVCCTRCVQAGEATWGGVCICRVPRDQLPPGKVVECVCCGCRGCGGGHGRKSGEEREEREEREEGSNS